MFQLLLHNLDWMIYNTLLAVIPVLLGWWAMSEKNKFIKICILFAWLIFVPNTIYIFTDIMHYFKDIRKVDFIGTALLTLQYTILLVSGLITYILSMYPIEKMLRKSLISKKNKKSQNFSAHITLSIISLNFIIGIGIVLGRIHRLNSWDILLGIEEVIFSVKDIFTSPHMIILALSFGLLANFTYFFFKKQTLKYLFKKYKH